MIIYVCHSSSFDYESELYLPLRSLSRKSDYIFIFPHSGSKHLENTKNIISKSSLVISEVSYPSIGLGIELGWADSMNKKILGVYKNGVKISSSLNIITSDLVDYTDRNDMLCKISNWLQKIEFFK